LDEWHWHDELSGELEKSGDDLRDEIKKNERRKVVLDGKGDLCGHEVFLDE